MTDNIFEIETTTLAHVACAPQDSGVLLTDFATAYPSANHSWIFSVLENTGLPDFLCRFLRSIYMDSMTHVEFVGAERGQFLMAKGVRQGCPAGGLLFAMAFDSIFRWLQESVILRNVGNLKFLQPAQRAYADNLAVASSSFRELMFALAPAFRSIDFIAGLNFNYRKCCWVQKGNEEHDSLRTWISENCEEFREMQIVRHVKDVGTMIGPNGHLHRWTAPRKKFIQRVVKINASTESLVGRLCDFKIYAISVLSFIGSVCAPDKATLKAENHALQCTTAGPYNAFPSSLLLVGSICGLGPDLVGIHSISLAARCWVAAGSSTLHRGLEKINAARGHNCTPLFALSPAWEHEFLFPSMTFHTANAFDIICRLDRDNALEEVPQYKKTEKMLPPVYFWPSCVHKTLQDLSSRASRVLGPISRHRIADILPHMTRGSCVFALVYSLASFASSVVGCVLHGDFTLQRAITPAVLDAPRLYNIFLSFWRHAAILPPRICLLHDLISRMFLRSLQYGIVVLIFLDAFVYAQP